MNWKKQSIIQRLHQLHRKGECLAYSRMAVLDQSLLSAAAYHFGSYRRAVEKSGIDYAQVIQRPKWTKQRIVAVIKQAHRAGRDLHWSAVISDKDRLKKAAFASIQPRLFGAWVIALDAAGLDPSKIAAYHSWDRQSIINELRSLARRGESLSSGILQKTNPGLHAAGVRYFHAHDRALAAAGLDPLEYRLRKHWDRKQIVQNLRDLCESGQEISQSFIRRHHPALYGATLRYFGTFAKARVAAKIRSRKIARDQTKRNSRNFR